MSLSSIHARQGRSFIIAAGLAVSLFALGCGRDSAESQAIERARIELSAMSSGETLTPAGGRGDVYQSVLAELRPVADRGTASQNAAAALLMAQAQAGLAQPAMARAAELEAQALHQIGAARSMYSQWLVHSAAAESAGSFDPAPEIKTIEEQVRARQESVSQADAQKATVDARVADLRRQAKAKGEQASSLRQEVGRLRQQVANQTAVEGEQSLIKSRELARQADSMEVEAADLEARAEQLDPEIREIATRIEGVRDQITRLGAARAEIEARAAASLKEASEARAAAARIAQELHAELGRVRDLREGELKEVYESAVAGYQNAVALARKAVSENRTAANMAIGSAQQSIGDLYWSLAQNLEFHQQVLTRFAESVPALPHGPQYAQLAQRVIEARKAAAEAATEAYQAAHTAYQAGGGSSERITRVANALNYMVGKTSDGKLDLGAMADDEGGSASGQDRGWTADTFEPGATPQETLARFAAALEAGDPAAAQLVYVEHPEQQRTVEAMFSIAPAGKRFSDALAARYGAEGEDALKNLAGGQSGMPDLGAFDPENADITIDGDRAEARVDDDQTLKLREVGGVWLIDLSEELNQPGIEMMVAIAPQLSKAFNELAEEVEGGKYTTIEEAFQAMMMKMMRLGGAMPGGGR
jgi:predicted  nucleic acid-binding Zn-ribbon protein